MEVKTQLQVTKTVKITNKAGFHLRPMNQIVKVAETAQSDVTLIYKSCRADCKSSWDLLSLIGAEEGAELTLCAEGSDAAEIVDKIETLFLQKFGEDEFATSPAASVLSESLACWLLQAVRPSVIASVAVNAIANSFNLISSPFPESFLLETPPVSVLASLALHIRPHIRPTPFIRETRLFRRRRASVAAQRGMGRYHKERCQFAYII